MVSFEQAVSQQLCGILNELKKMRELEEIKESRDVGVVYIAIPENAGTRSFSIGITKINFISGTITNPDGSTEQIQIRLDRLSKDFLHSLSLTSDQDIVLQIGSGGKKTVQSNLSLEIPYSTFDEITITTTQTTNISIYASTNPFSTVNGNTISIMKGQYAGNLVTVALDASGNILGVLKGDYGGTLKTLATDDQGRILAKIYDPNNVFGNSITIGPAELASRIGSPLMYDKLGEVIWFDDFEGSVLKWILTTTGAGSTASLDKSYMYTGDQSCKFVTGSTSGDYAMITRGITTLSSSKIGIELAFACAEGAQSPAVELHIHKDDGTTLFKGEVRYIPYTGVLQVNDPSLGWGTSVSSVKDYLHPQQWGKLKFVVDLNTNKYSRVQAHGVLTDLSTMNLVTAASAGVRRVYVEIKIGTPVMSAQTAYIDDVVVTMNEP